jgi:hypothetical protein
MEYVTPKEAATILGLSRAAISSCVAKGAPVHRWGPTGYRYKIIIEEFIAWMDQQGRTKADPPRISDNVTPISVGQMAQRRHELLNALS